MKKVVYVISAVILTALMTGCSLFGSSGDQLKLEPAELELKVGESAQLDAGDAAKLKWTSDNESVAAVHAGTVSAKAPGTAMITVTAENGDSQTCRVTVEEKQITSVSLGSSSVRLGLGKTIQLSASFEPADATDRELTWSSQNESVAKVDDKGFVTGQSAGTTVIECSSKGGVTASCAVIVDEAPDAPTAAPYSETVAATTAPTSLATEAKSAARAVPASSDDFIFPDSSTRMLTESEVAAKLSSMSGAPVSGSFSQDAVNEIFARHGYVFTTGSLKAYYESKSWYKPDPGFSMSSLSEIEEYNISLFGKY